MVHEGRSDDLDGKRRDEMNTNWRNAEIQPAEWRITRPNTFGTFPFPSLSPAHLPPHSHCQSTFHDLNSSNSKMPDMRMRVTKFN